MKRVVTLILCLALTLTFIVGLVACNQKLDRSTSYFETVSLKRAAEIKKALMAESYPNYAEVCDVDKVTYPELEHLGLKLVTGYGDNEANKSTNDWSIVNEIDADDVDGIQEYFDPNKDIMILVHGIQINEGRFIHVTIQSDSRPKEIEAGIDPHPAAYFEEAVGDYTGKIDLSKYYKDNGFNVFYFHYENFADPIVADGLNGSMDAVTTVTNNIWSSDSIEATYTRNGEVKSGAKPFGETNYSVAEFYVAEYLRAVNAIKSVFPTYAQRDRNVISAAHSMGGVVNIASTFLLTQVADAGQIEWNLVTNRLVQMDPYVGEGTNKNISWTKEQYLSNSETDTYATCVELLVKEYNIATYFVCNDGFAVTCMVVFAIWDEELSRWTGGEDNTFKFNTFASCMNRILECCPFVVAQAYYPAVEGESVAAGTKCHNAMREYALSSIFYDAPKATLNGKEYTVPTMRMSDEDIIKLGGYFFRQVRYYYNENGEKELNEITGKYYTDEDLTETMRCDDDTFVMWKQSNYRF